MRLYIEARRKGYSPDQCGKTMTVGELIEALAEYDEDTKVYISNDGGYTYGNIDFDSFDTDHGGDDE
jgi:hypothetical protein